MYVLHCTYAVTTVSKDIINVRIVLYVCSHYCEYIELYGIPDT